MQLVMCLKREKKNGIHISKTPFYYKPYCIILLGLEFVRVTELENILK